MRRLPIALLACLPLAPPAAAQAPEGAVTTTLPDVVVTATPIPTPQERLPAAVTVITRDEIELRGYRTLAEALLGMPGLRLVQTGGPGQQASAFLRGAASRHVLVLLDGVPLNDPAEPNGAFNFGNELLGDIERIEVVRGPASTFYGSAALGGVVNLITRRAAPGQEAMVFGEAAAGTQRTVRGVLGAAGNAGPADWLLVGQGFSSRGFDATAPRIFGNTGERDGLSASVVTARLGTNLGGAEAGFGPTRIEGLLRWRESALSLDNVPFDDPNYSGDDRNWLGFLRGETVLLDGRWTTGLVLSGSSNRRRFEDLPDAGNPVGTYDLYRGSRMTLDWGNQVALGSLGRLQDVALTFGASHEREWVDSASGSPPFRTTVDASARSNALRAGAQFRVFERLDVTAGLRHDEAEDYGGYTSWRLGAVLAVPEVSSRLWASAGTAFKAPSLFQRFGVTGDIFRGNPDLKPERSLGWEAGVETEISRAVSVSAVYFGSQVRDLINFDAGFSTLTNVDRARIHGAELGLTLRPARWLSARIAWTITDARDEATDQRLARRPEHVVSAQALITPVRGLVIAPEVLFTGRSPEGPFASYDDAGNPFPTMRYNPSGTVFNLTVTWQAWEKVALFAEGRNLGNSRFEPANAFVVPGRSLLVGTRATF